MFTKDFIKHVRNSRLAQSDIIIADLTDEVEIARWAEYRQKLRDFFNDKPDDFDYEHNLVWPRTPNDIDALKEKAAAGDTDAAAIIARDNL